MAKQLFIFDSKRLAEFAVAEYVIDWCQANQGCGLGGATGRSPVGVWAWIWEILGVKPEYREAVVGQHVMFLDEYFGPYPSYHHWAWQNLRIGSEGFSPDNVHVPRGCFFEPFKEDRIVTSRRLAEILAEKDFKDDWDALTEPGDDGKPPEIRIKEKPGNALLAEIRRSLSEYDARVRNYGERLQLLGIGVGGASDGGGHIGFVEYGAAAGDTQTMLVKLARSTRRENQSDFVFTNADGDVSLEPSHYAVTQGISTILSAGELLLMAWGRKKQVAVERMFFGVPGPKNPAGWVQRHSNVTVFLDSAALGNLDHAELAEHGWSIKSLPVVPSVMGLLA